MLNKIKKVIMPLMLGAFLFGGIVSEFNLIEPVSVYAAPENNSGTASNGGGGRLDANGMPQIQFDDNGLNLGNIQNQQKETFFNRVLKEYRTVVIFISGIGTISMILFFIMNFINLGKSQGNPQERQKAITGLIISGIASAGLGSVTLIVTLFYNVFSG